MLNKQVLALSPGAVSGGVRIAACSWLAMICNLVCMGSIAWVVQKAADNSLAGTDALRATLLFAAALIIRSVFNRFASKISFTAGNMVKAAMREKIYLKLASLGPAYHQKFPTAEAVQLSGEGVEQMEIWFGRFLPQLFYSIASPLTLFAIYSFIRIRIAVVLLVCVPLIPLSLAAVGTIAKRTLGKYWKSYANLGDSFLENLQGITTLKLFSADEKRHREMNANAESFRVATMRVLYMQLNSITVMDIIAWGGSAAAMVLAALDYRSGSISLAPALFIILTCSEFFLPLRALGGYFHTAMNAAASGARIEKILAVASPEHKAVIIPPEAGISFKDLSFSWDGSRNVLDHITFDFKPNSFNAIVGESGSGKSTIASLIGGFAVGYSGSLTIGGIEVNEIQSDILLSHITTVRHNSYLFAGTVRDTLAMGNSAASDAELENALEKASLLDFVKEQGGLDMMVKPQGSNLSGGQRQRLAIARALLKDSPVYIFDEAASNIDRESEEEVLKTINSLKNQKLVILITHRLAAARNAECIAVLDSGKIAGTGSHEELLKNCAVYQHLWNTQSELESITASLSAEEALA